MKSKKEIKKKGEEEKKENKTEISKNLNWEEIQIPEDSGIYIFKDLNDKIIYIGKAKNLKKRIQNYKNKKTTSIKTKHLINNIHKLEFIIVDTELEALILEDKLIKKHKPKYNINLKDSKTYPYILITDEKIPKIIKTRKKIKKGKYYGPYSDSDMINNLIRIITSTYQIITPKTFSSKSTLYYEIGLAPAKNIKEINIKEYLDKVKKAKEILSGKKIEEIIKILEEEMKKKSNELKFEIALKIKKQIGDLKKLKEKQKIAIEQKINQDFLIINNKKIQIYTFIKGTLNKKEEFQIEEKNNTIEIIKNYYSAKSWIPKEIILNEEIWENFEEKINLEKFLTIKRESKIILTIPKKGTKYKIIKMLEKNLINNKKGNTSNLKKIKKEIGLKKLPKIIECFDISNLNYENLVGAMTHWENEKQIKEKTRYYNIKSFKGKQDDYLATKEVIERRLENKEIKLPNLIIIDGGKGHLKIVEDTIKERGIKDIEAIGISKGKRRDKNIIHYKNKELDIDKNKDFMLLLRKIRDTTHNTVISFNRRKQKIIK